MRSGNLHDDVPVLLPEEVVTRLAGAGSVRVERIVSRGHCSPVDFWYDQCDAEYVLLLSGEAVLEFEDGEGRRLGPGDWIEIAPHVRHRVTRTATDCDTIWLAVFYPGEADS